MTIPTSTKIDRRLPTHELNARRTRKRNAQPHPTKPEPHRTIPPSLSTPETTPTTPVKAQPPNPT